MRILSRISEFIEANPAVAIALILLSILALFMMLPVILFIPTYIRAPKSLYGLELEYFHRHFYEPFIFLNDPEAERSLLVSLIRITASSESPDVYIVKFKLLSIKSDGILIGTDNPMPEEGDYVELCSCEKRLDYSKSNLLRLLIVEGRALESLEGHSVGEWVVYKGLKRSGFTKGVFAFRPHPYLGYSKTWVAKIHLMSGESILSKVYDILVALGEERDIEYMSGISFVRYGEVYVAYSISYYSPLVTLVLAEEFGSECQVLVDILVSLDRVLDKLRDMIERGEIAPEPALDEFTVLRYSNRMPAEQAWLEVPWSVFNDLFPVSHVIVVISLILIVVGVRRR